MTSHNIDHVHHLTTRVRHIDHITKKRDTNHMTDHLTDTNDCTRNTKLNHMTLMSENPGNCKMTVLFFIENCNISISVKRKIIHHPVNIKELNITQENIEENIRQIPIINYTFP